MRRVRLTAAILALLAAALPSVVAAADELAWREISHTDASNVAALGELTEMAAVVRLSNGTFVSVGSATAGSEPMAWRSSDGARWSAVAVPDPGLAGIRDVAIGPDGRLIAVGYRGGSAAGDGSTQRAAVWTSADGGGSWTVIPDQDGFVGSAVNAVAVSADGHWVAVGASATERRALTWTSPDGMRWTRAPDLETFLEAELHDVTAGSGDGPAFLAVGGAPVIQGAVWISDDGVSWEPTAGAGADPAFNNSVLQAVTAGGVGYVAAGLTVEIASFDAAFWTSTDGLRWVPATDPEGADEQPIMDVAATPDGGLVAVGFGLLERGSIWESSDGTDWRQAPGSAELDLAGAEPRGVVGAPRSGGADWLAVGARGHRPDAATVLTASAWTTLELVTSFVGSLPTPLEISLDPVVIATGAAAAAGVVLVIPFPGALFNSTWEANADEIGRWGRSLRRRRGRVRSGSDAGAPSFWQRPLGIGAFFVISALLYSFLDPTFGPADIGASLVTFAGIGAALVAGTLVFAVPTLVVHWLETREVGRLRVLPGTIAVAAACVLLTRLTGFQPGYLYGLVIGFIFATELGSAAAGRSAFIAAAWMLVVGLAAWIALIPVEAAAAGGSVGPMLMQATLTTLVVGGLEGVAIGLLPMRFLPGEAVLAWSRRAWATLFGIGVFAFLHVLINPSSGYLADTERAPLLTIVVLLAAFGAASVGLWAWFRFRPTRPQQVAAVP
jgi:hypothetical protein